LFVLQPDTVSSLLHPFRLGPTSSFPAKLYSRNHVPCLQNTMIHSFDSDPRLFLPIALLQLFLVVVLPVVGILGSSGQNRNCRRESQNLKIHRLFLEAT